MKKMMSSGALCVLQMMAAAQQPYPTPPVPPPNITTVEYFIDYRQDFGSGASVNGINPAPNIIAFSTVIDLTGVPNGLHRLYIRSKDAQGQWSATQNSFFDNYSVPVYPTPAPAVNISAIEYFTDGIQNFGSGSQLP